MPTRRSTLPFTLPGLEDDVAIEVADILAGRLVSLVDLSLVLKHVHWNVVGPSFIGVHLMLDPQVAAAGAMADTLAERIAALGASPNGLAGNIVETRAWDEYPIGRATTTRHLAALDQAYNGVITSHRKAIDRLDRLDPVSQDLLIGQTAQLEQFQWFVRAHLETDDGTLVADERD
jgi:starvation-inducible DNA-binding protein